MVKQLHDYFLKSTGVSTDTRKISTGNIFFALKGDNFNGNLYASKALEQGASYVVIDEVEFEKDERFVLVEDVLKTLQDLANYHRRHLGIPILSLTGSNGKTTTKELINVVLSSEFKTVATKGNLNNHIGVPLTLLSMNHDTEIGIVEMGANHLKEIAQLCEIAEPNFGYITNFGKAHLEGFGSLEGVVKGKSELYQYLRRNDQNVFVNSQDMKQMELTSDMSRFTFGVPGSDYVVHEISANPLVSIETQDGKIVTNLIGLYNGYNVAAAAAIGKHFNISFDKIKRSLGEYIPANNRSQIIDKGNVTIILDAYNANPSSMTVALENLKQLPAERKIAVLGDMFELGETAMEEHQDILNKAEGSNLDRIILVGKNFQKTNERTTIVEKYNTTEAALASLTELKDSKATILIKGSRGMALERLLEVF